MRLFLALLLSSALFPLAACRDEAPDRSAPVAIEASLKITRVDNSATSTTPAHACAHAPHLVILTRGDSAAEFAIAHAFAPELSAAPALRSARVLPGPGQTPAEVILVVDASEIYETQSASETKFEGYLNLRLLSSDSLGGLARKVRGRVPRPSFDHRIKLKVEATARAASAQLARNAIAEALAQDQAAKLANMLEGSGSPLPWVLDPETSIEAAAHAALPEISREEIRLLGGGTTATGDLETIYRVAGGKGRGPFVLDLMANLQKAGFRTLTRRSGDNSSVLAMRDDRRQITLSIDGEVAERGQFGGFMILQQAPDEAAVEARLDRIAAGAAPVPALLALRRDLGPPRFAALAKTLRERRAKWGLDADAQLALAEIERTLGEEDAARRSFRLASLVAWVTARSAEEFPGADLLARNLGIENEASRFAQAPDEDEFPSDFGFLIPEAGEPLIIDVPASESALIVIRGAAEGVLKLDPGPGGRLRHEFFDATNGKWGSRISGDLGYAQHNLPTCRYKSEPVLPDRKLVRFTFTPAK